MKQRHLRLTPNSHPISPARSPPIHTPFHPQFTPASCLAHLLQPETAVVQIQHSHFGHKVFVHPLLHLHARQQAGGQAACGIPGQAAGGRPGQAAGSRERAFTAFIKPGGFLGRNQTNTQLIRGEKKGPKRTGL